MPPVWGSAVQERHSKWERVKQGANQDGQDLMHFLLNERLRELDLVTLKEIGFGELKSNSPILMRRLSKRWSQTLHSSAWWEDKRQWAQAKAREAQTGCKKKLSHHTDSQGLDEAVQEGYIVSVLDQMAC